MFSNLFKKSIDRNFCDAFVTEHQSPVVNSLNNYWMAERSVGPDGNVETSHAISQAPAQLMNATQDEIAYMEQQLLDQVRANEETFLGGIVTASAVTISRTPAEPCYPASAIVIVTVPALNKSTRPVPATIKI